jgi:hypothetical protein
MCAYAFFRDNYIGLPKDITNYIILFLLPSDDDVICGYVMESKLLKIQAEGLNYLFNKIFLNYWVSA